jgi:hypothetical protein
MQHAAVYLRSNGYFLHSDSQATSGVWMASPPFLTLPPNVSADSLGQAVLDVLSASKRGVAHPLDWDKVEFPLPEMAGVKSWAQFIKGSRCVTVVQQDGTIQFRPSANRGADEGFTPHATAVEISTQSDSKAVATALVVALERCE